MSNNVRYDPSRDPNYELLKRAYAIIDGIPEEAFDLHDLVTKEGPSLGCGTICCAAGWLSLHPIAGRRLRAKITRTELGKKPYLEYPGDHWNYCFVMQELFNLTSQEVDKLFSQRGRSEYDESILLPGWLTDKQLWQHRVRKFLKQHGQL